jgi:Xaa-Pro aminopeptidase
MPTRTHHRRTFSSRLLAGALLAALLVPGAAIAKPKPRKAGSPAPIDPYAAAATPTAATPAPVDPYASAPAAAASGAPVDPYAAAAPAAAAAGPTTPRTPGGLDIAAAQGLIAVRQIDGWLLFDRAGQDPVAGALVGPSGAPQRAWFYFVPQAGTPTLLVHDAELAAFAAVPGTRVTYASAGDLDAALGKVLTKRKVVAMSYSPRGALPSMSRVDGGTLDMVRGHGVKVVGAESLVQGTKAHWSEAARAEHGKVATVLTALHSEVVAHIARQFAIGATVTEWSVSQALAKQLDARGLVALTPVVAAGVNTADPAYAPTARRSAQLRRGDLVTISLAAKTKDAAAVYGAASWTFYLGATAPADMVAAFELVARARDRVIALIRDRAARRRTVTGADADAEARAVFAAAGYADMAPHRTGHSLDRDLLGSGADLDSVEVRDDRPLVASSGFTIGPGLYFAGKFGVRAEVSAALTAGVLDVTTPVQAQITPIALK